MELLRDVANFVIEIFGNNELSNLLALSCPILLLLKTALSVTESSIRWSVSFDPDLSKECLIVESKYEMS